MNLSAASLSLNIASFQTQTLNSLFSSGVTGQDFMALLADRLQPSNITSAGATSALSNTDGIVTTGRNMSLFDPESAYRMMSDINNRDVTYKAQYAEMSDMEARLKEMEDAGDKLGNITLASSNENIKSGLQDFMDQYNRWIQRFGSDLQQNGLLAGTQAAQVSQYELEQSVKYMYNGAKDGIHGLSDLGLTIDPNTHLASLDPTKFDSVLTRNKLGVVDTIQEFSANFTKSADLLTSEGNFVPRQLDNLQHAISYISQNISDWRQEFGTGDAAKPSRQVTLALAAYNQNYAA